MLLTVLTAAGLMTGAGAAPARAQAMRVVVVPNLVMEDSFSFIDAACLYMPGVVPGKGKADCSFESAYGRALPGSEARGYYLRLATGLRGEFILWYRARQDALAVMHRAYEVLVATKNDEQTPGEMSDRMMAYVKAWRIVREIDARLEILDASRESVQAKAAPFLKPGLRFESAHYLGAGKTYLVLSNIEVRGPGSLTYGASTTLPRVIGATPTQAAASGIAKTKMEVVR